MRPREPDDVYTSPSEADRARASKVAMRCSYCKSPLHRAPDCQALADAPMIGGHDIIVDGKVSSKAPDFVRLRLFAVWPRGVVMRADDKKEDLRPLSEPAPFWRTRPKSELLVWRLKRLAAADYPYPGMLHLFFGPKQITLVAGDDTLALAREIAVALRTEGFVR